jgi:hypothetical protein
MANVNLGNYILIHPKYLNFIEICCFVNPFGLYLKHENSRKYH